MKVTIYWDLRNVDLKDIPRIKKKIREKFNIPEYTTVNGETSCSIKDEDMELLRETERRGYIQIRNKKNHE